MTLESSEDSNFAALLYVNKRKEFVIMGKKANATVEGIITALNSYNSVANITTQIVSNVITSKKIKDVVRKVILDPAQAIFVPKIDAIGWDKCVEAFNAMLDIFPDKQLSELLNVTEMDISSYRDSIKEHPAYGFSMYSNTLSEFKDGVTALFRYKNAIIYFTAQTAVYTGRGRMDGQYKFTFEFISPTHTVYEEFVDKIEEARRYIEKGYYEQFDRRIKIIRSGRRGFQANYATVPNTVVIESAIRDQIELVINAVNKSDEIKDQFEVNKTIGVLLWGPPGTGKSTIVRYLAMRLKRTLVLTSADNLMDVIDYIKDRNGDQKFIILIEDIDFKFVDRRKLAKPVKKTEEEEQAEANDDDDDDSPTFAAGNFAQTDVLFQLLDGVLGDSKIMVCATTNYKDRLDPALIRDGRFDHSIEVNGLSMQDARDVCEKFGISPSDIKLETFSVPVNAATLQKTILKYKTMQKPDATE